MHQNHFNIYIIIYIIYYIYLIFFQKFYIKRKIRIFSSYITKLLGYPITKQLTSKYLNNIALENIFTAQKYKTS